MSFLGSLRTWLLFNNKINPQKYNLPNNSALPVEEQGMLELLVPSQAAREVLARTCSPPLLTLAGGLPVPLAAHRCVCPRHR